MEQFIRQSSSKPIYLLVEEISQVGLRRHNEVIYHLSGKAVDAALVPRRAIQGHVEETADLSLEGLVGLHYRGIPASSLHILSRFGGTCLVRLRGRRAGYCIMVGPLFSIL